MPLRTRGLRRDPPSAGGGEDSKADDRNACTKQLDHSQTLIGRVNSSFHPRTRKARPCTRPRSPRIEKRYFLATTVTLRVSVVLRPFVLSTIVNVALTLFPAGALTVIGIAVVFPAATF